MLALLAVAVGCAPSSLGGGGGSEGGAEGRADSGADATRDAGGAGADAQAGTDGAELDRDGGPDPDGGACGCFGVDGTRCAASAQALARERGCALPIAVTAGSLLRCAAGRWTVAERCANGCEPGETDATDACALPTCPCFVREAWCGASAARHGLTLTPACRVPLSPEHDEDLLGCDASGRWVVRQACAMGCFQAPTGVADSCVSTRSPTDPGWPACPSMAQLRYGVHPEASDRLRCAGVTAAGISQTLGGAPASAGYHLQDGTAMGLAYSAATDIRTVGMSESAIGALLDRLAVHGFAAWYRKPGADGWPADEAPHIHAVFAGVVMKVALRGQVRDWLLGLNGLTSHTRYRFWSPSPAARATVRALFARNYTPP
jgi:hypothetical protein